MARVLVIGGTLFIGCEMVQQLLERGDDVVVMHRSSGTPFGDRVEEILCDRNDGSAVRAALADRSFDLVFDNVYDWQRGTTAEPVVAAAEAVGTVRRYVFMSTIAVYGHGGEHDEDAPLVPSDHPSPYAAQKADSERALFELQRRGGPPVTTIRPSFVYGPGNPFERETFFWDRLLAGRPIIVPEDGQAPMQWVKADEVARAAILAATEEVAVGRAYNVAGYPPITQEAYVRCLAEVAGVEPELVYVPRERIQEAGGELTQPPLYFGVFLDIPPLTVSAERLASELGLRPTPLEEGLRETYRWYREQDRPTPDFTWEDELLASAGR